MVTVFGSVAVGAMMLSYGLEARSRWFVLLFALASGATSLYSGLVAAYPITVIEAVVVPDRAPPLPTPDPNGARPHGSLGTCPALETGSTNTLDSPLHWMV